MDNNLSHQDELVSIIMPAYNASAFIKDSITSVSAQTYSNWELIVIDDGSTDDTPAIVKTISAQDDRVIYHRQDNMRLGAARNTGFKLARGSWIAFLDADDLWLHDKLESQMASLAGNANDPDIIFTAGYYLYGTSCRIEPYDSLTGLYSGKCLYPLLLKHNHIAILSVMFKKTLIRHIGGQDTDRMVFGNEDWDFWLKACRARANFLGLSMRSFKYRLHDKAMSLNKTPMLIGAIYVICKNYDKRWLSADEQCFHQAEILARIPFVCKQLLRSRTEKALLCGLLFRMISISFPLLGKPGIFFQAVTKHQG